MTFLYVNKYLHVISADGLVIFSAGVANHPAITRYLRLPLFEMDTLQLYNLAECFITIWHLTFI